MGERVKPFDSSSLQSSWTSSPMLRMALAFTIISTMFGFQHYRSLSLKEIPRVTIETSTTTTTKSPYKIIAMNNRQPIYKLATMDGGKPYADGDRAQAFVVKHLKLIETCREDPSLIVVDVGAFLGDFGLYAAACGCPVYLFEVQPGTVDAIKMSISVNNFTRAHVFHKAVSDLPSNSNVRFKHEGGATTQTEGELVVSTIRLDDFAWPPNSTIFLLKIDVEGFELNVLRSAERLFREKRIQHVIFEYSAYWGDRAPQQDVLPYVHKTLGSRTLYALHRTERIVYGPLNTTTFKEFHEIHVQRHLQTDIYAVFADTDGKHSINARPYDPMLSFA